MTLESEAASLMVSLPVVMGMVPLAGMVVRAPARLSAEGVDPV